jgi:pyrimidine deaminase RibD-like protein/RNA-binding protein YhbY
MGIPLMNGVVCMTMTIMMATITRHGHRCGALAFQQAHRPLTQAGRSSSLYYQRSAPLMSRLSTKISRTTSFITNINANTNRSTRHTSTITTSLSVINNEDEEAQGGSRVTVEQESSTPAAAAEAPSTAADFLSGVFSQEDISYMNMALDCAAHGSGVTYPNPAVGCVLVRRDSSDSEATIVGKGFHPKAGMPHAEVFALLEACGAVESGVEAAQSVLPSRKPTRKNQHNEESDSTSTDSEELKVKVQKLLEEYSSEGGAKRLFENCCTAEGTTVTAYVTLEPCCHTGQTPPCAMSLVHAGVSRVVVGVRDPNPRVNGGGVRVLEETANNNIQVDVLPPVHSAPTKTDGDMVVAMMAKKSLAMVDCFVKRITTTPPDYAETFTGAHRRALRKLAGQQQSEGKMAQMALNKVWLLPVEDTGDKSEKGGGPKVPPVSSLPAWWLEELDSKLWKNELVRLRFNQVISKKKLALQFGSAIADVMGAHVAQSLGHTILLYRPASPPVIDLEELMLPKEEEDEADVKAADTDDDSSDE